MNYRQPKRLLSLLLVFLMVFSTASPLFAVEDEVNQLEEVVEPDDVVDPADLDEPENPVEHEEPVEPEDPVEPDVNDPIDEEPIGVVKVTFDYNYEGAPEAKVIEPNAEGYVTPPEEPSREGYRFLGWVMSKEDTVIIDFSEQSFDSDTTVYAKWESGPLKIVVETNEYGKLNDPKNNTIDVPVGSTFSEVKDRISELVSPVHNTAATFVRWEKDGVAVSDEDLVEEGNIYTAIFGAAEGYREIRFEDHYGTWNKMSLTPFDFVWSSQLQEKIIDGYHARVMYGLAAEGVSARLRGSNLDTRTEVYFKLNDAEPRKITPGGSFTFFQFGRNGNQVGIVSYEEITATFIVRLHVGHQTGENKYTGTIFNAKRLGEERLQQYYLQRVENGEPVGDRRYFNLEEDKYNTANQIALEFKNIKLGTYVLGYEVDAPWEKVAESAGGFAPYVAPHSEFKIESKTVTRWVLLDSQLHLREVQDPHYYLGVGINGHQANQFINDPSQKRLDNLTGNELYPIKVKAYDASLGLEDSEENWVDRLVGRSVFHIASSHWDWDGGLDAVKSTPTDPEQPLSFRSQYQRTSILDTVDDLRVPGNKGYDGNTLYVNLKISIVAIPTLSFDPNGGLIAGSEATQDIKADVFLKVDAPETPVKEGSTFLGWFDAEGNEFDPAKQYLEDTIFSAKWKEVLKKDVQLRFFKDRPFTSASYRFSQENNLSFAEKFVLVNTETEEEYKADLESYDSRRNQFLIRNVPDGTYKMKIDLDEPFAVDNYLRVGGFNPEVLESDEIVINTSDNFGVGLVISSSIKIVEIIKDYDETYYMVAAKDVTEANAMIARLNNEFLPQKINILASNGQTYACELEGQGFEVRPFDVQRVGTKPVQSFFKLPEEVSRPEEGFRLTVMVQFDVRENPSTVSFDENYEGGNSVQVTSDQFFYVEAPEEPERAGFLFEGWFDAEGNEFDASKQYVDDTTFFAKWGEVPKKDVQLRFFKDRPFTSASYRFNQENNLSFAEKFVLVNIETEEEYKADLESYDSRRNQFLIRNVPDGTYKMKIDLDEPFGVDNYLRIGAYNPEILESDEIVINTADEFGVGLVISSSIKIVEIIKDYDETYYMVAAKDVTEANAMIARLNNEFLPQKINILASNGQTYACELEGQGFEVRPFDVQRVGTKPVQSFFKLPEEVSRPEEGFRLTVMVQFDVRENPSTVSFDENYEGGNSVQVTSDQFFYIEAPEEPERTGFLFEGWFDAEGNEFDASMQYLEDTTFFAKWEKLVDKSALQDMIDRANEEDLDGKTKESLENFQKALAAAIEINENENATQEEVDEATQNLKDAIDNLEDKQGWKYEDGKWFYYVDGLAKTGWFKVNSAWYYADENGEMQTGWLELDGTRYYLTSTGVMATNWVQIGKDWYYFGRYGAMQTGWNRINEIWYYMDASGVMQTGWLKLGEHWYYLGKYGAMQTGWKFIDGYWYYLQSSGVMKTGWLKLDNSWYYLKSNGVMVTGRYLINGQWYTFDASGRLI